MLHFAPSAPSGEMVGSILKGQQGSDLLNPNIFGNESMNVWHCTFFKAAPLMLPDVATDKLGDLLNLI